MAYKAKYISKQLQNLQVEVSKHPDIVAKGQECETFSEVIGMIAAEVDVALDGYYTETDLDTLYVILTNKLQARRSPIILLDR